MKGPRSSTGSTRRVRTVVAVSAALPTLFTTGSSHATNWDTLSGGIGTCNGSSGSSGSGRPADNDLHTYNFQDLTAAVSGPAADSMAYYNATAEVDTQSVALSSTTDAVLFDQDYTTWCGETWDAPGTQALIGLRECIAANSASRCERSEIRFDYPDFSGKSALEREYYTCHEIGHSFGLNHRSSNPNGCMNADFDLVTSITDHDKNHLDSLPNA